MKHVRTIIGRTLWVLLLLYLGVAVVLHVPIVQHTIGDVVASALSDKLETKVSVGRVDLGFLNRVIIDDVVICDRQHQQMLRASRISAKVGVLPLINGRIRVSSAQLFGLKANLYRSKVGQPANFQFVIDALSSKDTGEKTPMDLQIASLVVRNGNVAWNQLDVPRTPSRLNTAHIEVSKLSAHVIINALSENRVDVRIKKLAFKEASGLDLRGLTMALVADKKKAEVKQLTLQLAQTHVEAERLTATYQFGKDGLDLKSLKYAIDLKPSQVWPSDFSFLLPSLHGVQQMVHLRLKASGTSQRVDLSNLAVESGDRSVIVHARGSVKNLGHTPVWNVSVHPLKIDEKGFDLIAAILKDTGGSLPPVVQRLGSLNFQGHASGRGQDMAMKGTLETGIGDVQLQASLHKMLFAASVKTGGFLLNRLLDNDKFGEIVADVVVSGSMPDKKLSSVTAKGTVSRFDFNQYSYRNISIDGSYKNDAFVGRLAMDDPNGRFQIDGNIENIRTFLSKEKQLAVMAKAEVVHFNPYRLKLTEALGDRTISVRADADVHLLSIDDLVGTLNLGNISIAGEGNLYNINQVHLVSSRNSLQKSVTLESDMGDAEISGQYSYATIVDAVKNVLRSKMPSLIGGHRTFTASDNRFALSATLRDASLLNSCLHIPLQLRYDMTLEANVDERNGLVDAQVYAPSFSYNGTRIDNTLLMLETMGDSIYIKGSGDHIGQGGNPFSVRLEALAHNDVLKTYAGWNANRKKSLYGSIDTNVRFFREKGRLGIDADIFPSVIQFDTVRLAVQPSSLTYYNKELTINHFEVSNGDQHIAVNGHTSGRDEDSLKVDLKNLNVAYILDLVNFHSVDFAGLASGTASVKSLFHQPSAIANLMVDDFTFNEGRMGTLHAKVGYDGEKIDIDAVADDGPEAKTLINGYVSLKDNYMDLPIFARGTRLEFLESFCGSFLDNVDGHGYGRVRVFGDLKDVNIEGDVRASGTMNVTSLRTTYSMRDCDVHIIPDHIELLRDTVYDKYGHIGIVTGELNHQSLRNLTYDINVEAQNLLAYDHKSYGDNTFYGTVFATGNCAIRGKSGELVIDVNAVPEAGSFIEYNATYADAAEKAEYIKWNTEGVARTENSDISTKDSLQTDGNRTTDEEPHGLTLSPFLPSPSSLQMEADIPTDMHINFLVNANDNFTLRVLMDAASGDYIALNGDGVIRATYFNKGAFQMYGNYNVNHGVYKLTIQNLIKKDFQFQSGSTIAFGGDPYSAALNLKGVYTVNGASLSDLQLGNSFTRNNVRVNCLMDIKGTPEHPTVDFDLDLPTLSADAQAMVRSVINSEEDMNQQVLYLLAVGRFYPQGNNNAVQDGTAQNQTSLAMQSLLSGTISQQINTVLSSFVKSSDWNFGANISTGDEGFSNAEYEGLLSGRMFNNRLLFNGQFGYRDNVTTNTSSFIGDFDLRYLLTPNGNLAVRVYNQTNDRYFTRNSLNTQGIGVILKKDFNSLKDLFWWRKKKSKK